MKLFDKSILAAAALLLTMGFVACEDANEFEDARTDNPAWGMEHPDSLAQQVWVRGEGIKFNAYGEEVQGFVESMDFYTKDSVVVTMSKGKTAGTMGADDSNTRKNPYEYEYVKETGTLKVLKEVKDERGNTSKIELFSGVASGDAKHGVVLTVVHYGDTPAQTYLVRK